MRAHPLILVLWGVVLFTTSCTSSRTRGHVDRLSSSLVPRSSSSSSEEHNSDRYSQMMAQFGAASYEESGIEESLSEEGFPHEPRVQVKRLVAPQDGLDYEVYQGVMGRPGVDFPVLPRIPKTSFSCRNVKNSGYYADLDTDCQVFHICDEGRKISFLCPNGTIFRQSHLICDWWWTVDCASSVEQYEQSAEQLAYDQRRYRSRQNSGTSAASEGVVPAEQRQQQQQQQPQQPRGRQLQFESQQQTTNSYSNVRYNSNNYIENERQLPAETGSFVNSRANTIYNNNQQQQQQQQFASSTAAPVYTTGRTNFNNNNNFRNNYYNNNNEYRDFSQTTPQYVQPLTTVSPSNNRFQQQQQTFGRSYVNFDRSRTSSTTTSSTVAPFVVTSASASRRLKPAAVEVVNRGNSRYFSTTTTAATPAPSRVVVNSNSKFGGDFNSARVTPDPSFNAISTTDVYRSSSKPTSKPIIVADTARNTTQKSTSARGRKLRPVYVQVINRGTPKPQSTTPNVTSASNTEVPTTVATPTITTRAPVVVTQSPKTTTQSPKDEVTIRIDSKPAAQQKSTSTTPKQAITSSTTKPTVTTTKTLIGENRNAKAISFDTKAQKLASSEEYSELSGNIEIFPPSGMPFTDEDVVPTKQTSTTSITEQTINNKGGSKFNTTTSKNKPSGTAVNKPIIVHAVSRDDSKPTAVSYSEFTLNPPRSSAAPDEDIVNGLDILSSALPQGFQTPTTLFTETVAMETTLPPTTALPSATPSQRRGNVHSSARVEQDLFSSDGSVETRSFSSSRQNALFNSQQKGVKAQQGVEVIEKVSAIAMTTRIPASTTEATTTKFESKQPDVHDIQVIHRGDSNVRPDLSYTTTDSPAGVTDIGDLLAYSTISENDLPSTTGFPIYGRKFSVSDETSSSKATEGSSTARSAISRGRKTFQFADAPRRRLISTTTTTPSLIQRALSKRLKTTPLPIPIRTATASKPTTTLTTPSTRTYQKSTTTIRPLSNMLLPPTPENDLEDASSSGKQGREPKNLVQETVTEAETHVAGDRTGLDIPPSSGPGTLHSLATYFSTQGSGDVIDREVTESTTVSNEITERSFGTSTIDPEVVTTLSPSNSVDKDVNPPSILTKGTIDSYSSLFSNANNSTRGVVKAKSQDKKSKVPFILNPESSVPAREGRKFAFGNEPTASQSVTSVPDPADVLLKEDAPGLRELAQVFSRALSAYLDDPEEFRKVLSEVRPTPPPITTDIDTEFNPTTAQSVISSTTVATTTNARSQPSEDDDDEVLDFSDVSKSSRRASSGRKYNFRSSTSSPNLIASDKLSVGSTLSPEYATDVPKELLESLDKSQSQHYTAPPPSSVQTSQYSSTNIIAEAVNNLFDAPTSTDESVGADYTLPPGSPQYSGSEYGAEVIPSTAGGVGDKSRPRYGGFQNNSRTLKRINSAFPQTTLVTPTTTEEFEATTIIPKQKTKIVKPSRNLVPPFFDSPDENAENSSSEKLEEIFDSFVPEELNNLAVVKENVPKVLSAAGLNPSSPGVTANQFETLSSVSPSEGQPFSTASTGDDFNTFEPTAPSLGDITTINGSSDLEESLVAANSARFNSQRIQEVFNNLAASRKWDSTSDQELETERNDSRESIISELNSLLVDGISTNRPEPTVFPTTSPPAEFSTNPTNQYELSSVNVKNSEELSTELPTVVPEITTTGVTSFPVDIKTKRPPTHSSGPQPTHTSASLEKFKSPTGVFTSGEQPKRLIQIDGFSRMAISSKQFAEKTGRKFTKTGTNSVTTDSQSETVETTSFPFTVTPDSSRTVLYVQAQRELDVTTETPTMTGVESDAIIRFRGTSSPVNNDGTTSSEDMITVTPSNVIPNTDLPATGKETLINSPSTYYKDGLDLDSPSDSNSLTPEQLQSLGDLQKMLSLNQETSAFAEKMFMTLNETGKSAFVDMMKQVHSNSTVRRLVLLLVNRTEEEGLMPDEVRTQLIEALLKHPEEEIELASHELLSADETGKNRAGRKLSEGGANRNSVVATGNIDITTLFPPITTYRNKGRTTTSAPPTTKTDLLELITSKSKTSLDEVPSSTTRSPSRSALAEETGLSQDSDKRAIELLRSLYTLAARWG